MDSVLLEKLIIKGMLVDKNYIATLLTVFDKDYFDNQAIGNVYGYITNHFREYKNIPPTDIIINEFDKDGKTETKELFNEINSIDFDYAKNYDFLFNNTNEYLKEKSIKKAILSSVDIINKKENLGDIRKVVEDALCKDLKIDLGLDYFKSMNTRLERLFQEGEKRIPTGFYTLDEFINGGFTPYTLSIFVAKTHGGKSNFLANMASRQVLMGYNVVLVSLEMSEDAFSQRFDSIYSLLDINKIYRDKHTKMQLIKKLNEVKQKENRGNLFIKEMPTGKATIDDYKKYLRELIIRGIKPDIFICDYVNLMKPSYKSKTDNMYSDVKAIAEELRALSFEFRMPVVSVSQLNREGMRIDFDAIDFSYIAESTGLITTSDFCAIFGSNEDQAVYENELFYKIVKNRLGGRVGEVDKFYVDARSLKMYDSIESDLWFEDVKTSNDVRKMAEPKEEPVVRSMGGKSRKMGRK
jgi:replicative DNA helicase